MTRVCPAHLPGVELVVQAVRQSPTPRLPPASKICEEPCPPPRSDMCGYNISVSHPLFFLFANDPSSLFHYSALALLILSCSLIINRYVLLSYTRTYSYSVYVYRILRGPVGSLVQTDLSAVLVEHDVGLVRPQRHTRHTTTVEGIIQTRRSGRLPNRSSHHTAAARSRSSLERHVC